MTQKYKHLLVNEIKIWDKYLINHALEYELFEYDVHVGKLPHDFDALDTKWKKGARSVYLKRIDVVGFTPAQRRIIEVKPLAGLGAIGQIAGYLKLYDDAFSPLEELIGYIVTDRTDINTKSVAESHGIEIVEVGF